MESDWRFNVWNYGLSNVGTKLAARILTGPFRTWILLRRVGVISALCAHEPLFADTPYVYINATMPNPAANFPFGFDVEPD